MFEPEYWNLKQHPNIPEMLCWFNCSSDIWKNLPNCYISTSTPPYYFSSPRFLVYQYLEVPKDAHKFEVSMDTWIAIFDTASAVQIQVGWITLDYDTYTNYTITKNLTEEKLKFKLPDMNSSPQGVEIVFDYNLTNGNYMNTRISATNFYLTYESSKSGLMDFQS